MAAAARSDAQWSELFLGAALEPHLWDAAIRAMAQATGSRHGQMIGFGPGGAAFNWISDVDPAIIAASGARRIMTWRVAGCAATTISTCAPISTYSTVVRRGCTAIAAG